jgi:putative transposase
MPAVFRAGRAVRRPALFVLRALFASPVLTLIFRVLRLRCGPRATMPFQHKNIRLNRTNHLGQRAYFVTICCAGRRRVFANSRNAAWLIEALRKQAGAHRFAVGAYCAMPDHLHALVTGLEPTSDLLSFVKHFKQSTAREYGGRRQRRPPEKQGGRYKTTFQTVLWQKKFYDHILRPRDNADGVAGYIWFNPVRKGLCMDPREYPYSGSFMFDWTKAIIAAKAWIPEWKTTTSVSKGAQL